MRSILNIAAFTALIIGIHLAINPNSIQILLFIAWWLSGIYIALNHIQWKRRNLLSITEDRKLWIFYVWHSLSGPILLVQTLSMEYWHSHEKKRPGVQMHIDS